MVLAEDEDEEPSEEQRDAAVLVGKAELALVNHGLESFGKGLKLLKAKPESAFAQESIRAAQELEEYGVSLDLKVNHGKLGHGRFVEKKKSGSEQGFSRMYQESRLLECLNRVIYNRLFFVCTTPTELAAKVFDHAIQHLEDAQKAKAALIDSNPDVLSIYGSCLHSKARLVDNQSQSEDNPAKAYVEKAIEFLVKAEELQDEDGDAKTLEVVR